MQVRQGIENIFIKATPTRVITISIKLKSLSLPDDDAGVANIRSATRVRGECRPILTPSSQ